ncbi:MAG: hypothetical protein H0T46_33300 [Deltaproteobacteria bacterium]|nr:hypothetical protein [Deltaproteobacteria bacterium]
MLSVLLLAACGDDGAAKPDATVLIDAAIDAPLDAPACAAPMKTCGTACIAVATDELNCGDCGVKCKGGQACDGACACPANFIPATLPASSFDQFMNQGTTIIAIGPYFDSTGIHPFIFGLADDAPLNTDIDLSTVAVGSIPFVAAGYRLDTATFDVDASYLARAGTLRLTKRCATEVQGTLTNATFQGVTGGFQNPSVDSMGCTLPAPATPPAPGLTIAFHVMTAACP